MSPKDPVDRRGKWGAMILMGACAFVLAAGLHLAIRRAAVVPTGVIEPATTMAVTTTAAATAGGAGPTTSWSDVVGRAVPALAGAQELVVPVDLADAARVLIDAPIYLDGAGQIWVTDSVADPMATVLARAGDESVHVVPERVVFVHYANDEVAGVRAEPVWRKGNGVAWIFGPDGPQQLTPDPPAPYSRPGDLEFDRAVDWTAADAFVVPTAGGAVVFRRSPKISQWAIDLRDGAAAGATMPAAHRTQIAMDMRGVLIWNPTGGGVARYVDENWNMLDASAGWAGPILQLAPYLDGSVARVKVDGEGQLALDVGELDHPGVDGKVIDGLIDDLSDPDAAKRDQAFGQLMSYRSAAWPELLRRKDTESPGAAEMIGSLLRAKLTPTLGGMTPNAGKALVATRLGDGGAVIYLEAGVTLPVPAGAVADATPQQVIPAWISIRPGRVPALLPDVLTADLRPEDAHLQAIGQEWVRVDPIVGARRLVGNHLEAIVGRAQAEFSDVVGIDRRGRWLLRRPGTDRPTLVIDPTFPDPTPRLPVWTMAWQGGHVGWDDHGWPVTDHGGTYALHEQEWVSIKSEKDGDGFHQDLAGTPAAIREVDLGPQAVALIGNQTAIAAATRNAATTEAAGPLLWREADGSRYWGGVTSIEVRDVDGRRREFALGGDLAGTGDPAPRMIGAPVGGGQRRLFLFNQPGRVIRLRATPHGPQPLAVEAVFTRRIPAPASYQRIWLDPAGRIDMAFDENHLAIFFPDGQIPAAIEVKMPQQQLDEQRDAEMP